MAVRLTDYYRKKYGCKVYKLGIDAGFTCPNRDGTLGTGGCIFCGPDGGSAFAARQGGFACDNHLPSDGIQDENKENELCETPCDSVMKTEYSTTFKGIPYDTIIGEWFRRNGGEPEPGERNTKLHRLASHLRYITDNNEEHLLQIMPNYGLKEEEMKQLIHHACTAKFYGMPKVMKKLLSDVESKSEEESELKTHHSELITPPEMPRRLPPLIRLLAPSSWNWVVEKENTPSHWPNAIPRTITSAWTSKAHGSGKAQSMPQKSPCPTLHSCASGLNLSNLFLHRMKSPRSG